MMMAVAFIALALAVILQSIRLHQAHVREQRLRAELASVKDRLRSEREDKLVAEDRVRALEVEYRLRSAEARAREQRQPPPAAPQPKSVKYK
jgi:hypothetical protein